MQITWQQQNDQQLTVKQFLKRHYISQRMMKQLKYHGQILLNKQHTLPSKVVKYHDYVTVTLPDEVLQPLVADETPLNVIYEDSNWLIINKSAGISSVPGPSNRTTTLANRIRGHLLREGNDAIAHLVTRLDYDTSGIVLAAKNRLVHSLVQPQIEHHRFQKEYLAVVGGIIQRDEGMIDAPIGRVGDSPRREVTENGQSAQTKYQVLQRFDNATLVKVQLITGRTHQIRVHFTYLGHPLVGDQLYGGNMNLGIMRQALHAWQLTFYDPVVEVERHFEAPLPQDLQTLLKKLSKKDGNN